MKNTTISLHLIKEHLEKQHSYRIVFLGDSITSTEWVHPNWREIIEYVLKEELTKYLNGDWKTSSWGIRCFNCGFDGSTSLDLLNLLDKQVLRLRPNLVIYMQSSNDHHFQITPSQHQLYTHKLIEQILTKADYCILCSTIATPNEKYNQSLTKYVKQIESLFVIENTQYINAFNEFHALELSKLFTFKSVTGNEDLNIKAGEIDFAHPNQLGNAYIAKVILKQGFDLKFDPEKYLQETLVGKMYPGY